MNRLTKTFTKTFVEDGRKYNIVATAQLDDECNNKSYSFSITGKLQLLHKNGRTRCVSCGCIHEEISKHFPQLKKFIPLHLCNHLGQPLYPEANGQYHISNSEQQVAMRYLRITEEEYNALSAFTDDDERTYFKGLLFKLGIVDRWKKEADEFIKFLADGGEWENPYTPEEERFVLHLTDEEREQMEDDDFFSTEKLALRKAERKRKQIEDARKSVLAEYDAENAKLQAERDVKMYILDHGLSIENFIYYPHSIEGVFNWLDYRPKVSREEFDNFMSTMNYAKLPYGVKFAFSPKERH